MGYTGSQELWLGFLVTQGWRLHSEMGQGYELAFPYRWSGRAGSRASKAYYLES